jgi:hypothetical protein
MDLCCEFCEGRQGLGMYALELEVALMYIDGFEIRLTED